MPTVWETWGMQQHGLSYDKYTRPMVMLTTQTLTTSVYVLCVIRYPSDFGARPDYTPKQIEYRFITLGRDIFHERQPGCEFANLNFRLSHCFSRKANM